MSTSFVRSQNGLFVPLRSEQAACEAFDEGLLYAGPAEHFPADKVPLSNISHLTHLALLEQMQVTCGPAGVGREVKGSPDGEWMHLKTLLANEGAAGLTVRRLDHVDGVRWPLDPEGVAERHRWRVRQELLAVTAARRPFSGLFEELYPGRMAHDAKHLAYALRISSEGDLSSVLNTRPWAALRGFFRVGRWASSLSDNDSCMVFCPNADDSYSQSMKLLRDAGFTLKSIEDGVQLEGSSLKKHALLTVLQEIILAAHRGWVPEAFRSILARCPHLDKVQFQLTRSSDSYFLFLEVKPVD